MLKPIFELKGSDWMKGIALQSTSTAGGLFSRARGFDPFEKMDTFYPSLDSVERGSGTIVTDINHIIPFDNNGTPSAYLLSNRNTSNKSGYLINLSTGGVTDISSILHTNVLSGTTANVQMAAWFNGYLVFNQDGYLRKSDGVTNDTNIGYIGGSSYFYTGSTIAEGTLYIPAANSIATLDSSFVIGTAAYSLPTRFRIVDLEFDGDYIVIVADENQVSNSIGNTPTANLPIRCQVRFWNRTSGTATRIWSIPGESYLIGSAQLDGTTYIFGSKGIWTCSISQPPRLLRLWSTSAISDAPTSPTQITASNNSIYWIGGSGINQDIYAYGSPYAGAEKRWYSPFIAHGSSYSGRALAYTGNHFLVGTSSNHLFETSAGTSRSSTIRTVPIRFDVPYKFEKAVVQLLSPLSSGQTVAFTAHQGNDSVVVSDARTYSYSNKPNKQTLVFTRKAIAGGTEDFKDIILTLTTEGGVVVTGLQLYGTPQDPHMEI